MSNFHHHQNTSLDGAEHGSADLKPYVAHAHDHQHLQWIGAGRLKVLLDAGTTGGQLTVLDERLVHGDATPVHIHSNEDEIFFVVDGSISAWVGDQRHDLAEGGIVFLPRHIPHAIPSQFAGAQGVTAEINSAYLPLSPDSFRAAVDGGGRQRRQGDDDP